MFWKAVLVVLLVPATCLSIDVRSGERIKQTQPGATTNAAVAAWLRDRLCGERVQVSGTATLTLQPTLIQGFPPQTVSQILASGDFTQGLVAGGYAGGIGIDAGIVFSSGRVSDLNGPNETAPEASTFGAQGPNNAEPETPNHDWAFATAERIWFPGGQDGEGDPLFGDPDLNAQQPPGTLGFDAVALQFTIVLAEKGKLQIKLVLASDEYPEWVSQMKDDDFGVFVTGPGIPAGNRNMARVVVQPNGVGQERLLAVDTIGPVVPLRTLNQSPTEPHPQLGATSYNHEYDMFTKVLTRETKDIVGSGTYTVKVVLQDVDDAWVDSAVFLPTDSFRLINGIMQQGDFNGSGQVEQGDLDLVLLNWGKSYTQIPATWIVHRPLSGIIDQAEMDAVLLNWGKVQVYFKSDFNRDGKVDNADLVILNAWKNILNSAASIYEGDADTDGDVDECDNQWYRYETGQRPMPPGATENCTQFSASPPSSSFFLVSFDPFRLPNAEESLVGPLEPIAEEVVDKNEYPTMLSHEYPKAQAIAELLGIAEARWQSGSRDHAKLIWDSMTRVFGRDVLPASVIERVE